MSSAERGDGQATDIYNWACSTCFMALSRVAAWIRWVDSAIESVWLERGVYQIDESAAH